MKTLLEYLDSDDEYIDSEEIFNIIQKINDRYKSHPHAIKYYPVNPNTYISDIKDTFDNMTFETWKHIKDEAMQLMVRGGGRTWKKLLVFRDGSIIFHSEDYLKVNRLTTSSFPKLLKKLKNINGAVFVNKEDDGNYKLYVLTEDPKYQDINLTLGVEINFK